jgi:hypothetical protein
LIVYAGELVATLGAATPLVVEQVTTLVAAWAARIGRWLRDLISSIRNLLRESTRLGQLIEQLKGKPHAESGSESPVPHDSPPDRPDAHSGTPEPPDFTDPTVAPEKIGGYALSPDHPVGRNKYRVIHAATGLGPDDAAAVEQQIREGVRTGAPTIGKADQHGQRWAFDLPLTGPTGSIIVRTAWILDPGATRPRLTTISFPPKT